MAWLTRYCFVSDEAYGSVPVEQSIARALPLIEKSLDLDPLRAETHASLGLLRMLEWDTLASEAALKRAIELSPNLSKAHLWLYVTYDRAALHRNAFETLQRTFALDPLLANRKFQPVGRVLDQESHG